MGAIMAGVVIKDRMTARDAAEDRTAVAGPDELAKAEASLELPRLLERLHRRYLDMLMAVLQDLDLHDLSPVQAMLMLDLDASEVGVQELVHRGYYQPSHLLYNVKKLVAAGYVHQSRLHRDRRAVRLKLTEQGLAARRVLLTRVLDFDRSQGQEPSAQALEERRRTQETLRDTERRWDEYLRFRRV